MTTAPMRGPLIYRVLLLFASTLLGLFLVEGAVRVRQWLKYGTAGNTVYRFTLDPICGLRVPEPSYTTRTIRINSKGFRSPELVVPKPLGRIRLAFLGASTTFCAEVTSNEATWPDLVSKNLQNRWPELGFDYVNAGVGGYTVNSSLRNLDCRVKPLQPDVIVIYHAMNDLVMDTRELAVRQGLFSGKSVEESSFLARWSLAFYLIEKKSQMIIRQKSAAQQSERLDFDARTLSQGFHQRLRRLVEASQGTAPVVAIATFSTWVRRDQSPQEQLRACQSIFYYCPYFSVQKALQGFEEYNRVIREVGRETDAVLIEGEETIPGDDRHFNDSVHFKDAGARIMAQRVVTYLVQSEAFKNLVESRKQANRGAK